MRKLIGPAFLLVVIAIACGRQPGSYLSSPAPSSKTINGTLSGSEGPIQNAEVKLMTYKDENCVKLSQTKGKLSTEQAQQYKDCTREAAATTTDSQGKYAFANMDTGWYRLEFRWKTSVNPIKSNPMWQPIFIYREGEYLITFLATKEEPRYHGLAIGEAFQYAGTESSQKDLGLKL
jgi:hypothetical protein